MAAILELANVSRSYRGPTGDVRAVDDVSLTLQAGEFKAVVGPSGCGKSTLLLCAGGLLRPSSGTVTINGRDPYALSNDERATLRAESIGFVFQQFHLVPFLSVRENILSPMMAVSGVGRRRDADVGVDVTKAVSRADELIVRFGLSSRRDHVPAALSSGERQRTALARALLNQPKLLLADEPTGNLDTENAAIVLTTLREFAAAGGAVLLVTHDARAIEDVGINVGTVLKLRDGRLET